MAKNWFHSVVIPAKTQSDTKSTAKIEGSGAKFDSIKIGQKVVIAGSELSVTALDLKRQEVVLSDGKTYKVQKVLGN